MDTLKTTRVNLHLGDELPRIGSGFRCLEVFVGRKWVHIKYPPTGVKAKIRLSAFERLLKDSRVN